jgi:4-hydroxybenzoate polyprenyltransferase
MPADHEQRIAAAIAAVKKGQSQKAAAELFGVATSTLSDRLHGGLSREQAHEIDRLFSPEIEDWIIDWIHNSESAGRTPYRWEIVQFAQCILKAQGRSQKIGGHWVNRFIYRHPSIKTKPQIALEAARAAMDLPERIKRVFEHYAAVRQKHKLSACYIANMDEHGLQEGESLHGKVVGSSLTKRGPRQHSDATTWVTILETILADGRYLTPAVIFTGEHLQGQWFRKDFPNWKYEVTTTGWTANRIAYWWLKQVYLPETKPKDPRQWRLLFMDSHATHCDGNFMYEAWVNKVELIYLPSHGSHVAQPADVGVFSVLKRYFREEITPFAHLPASSPVYKRRFLAAYVRARQRTLQPSIITAAFRKSGLWPVNRRKPLENEKIVNVSHRPTTPEEALWQVGNRDGQQVWVTPKRSQDLRNQFSSLETPSTKLTATAKALVRKAGKSIDLLATELAAAKREIDSLKAENEGLQPTARKRVKKDPQDTFYNIPEIHKARVAAEEQVQRWTGAHKADFEKQQQIISHAKFESMLNEWHLEDN